MYGGDSIRTDYRTPLSSLFVVCGVLMGSTCVCVLCWCCGFLMTKEEEEEEKRGKRDQAGRLRDKYCEEFQLRC